MSGDTACDHVLPPAGEGVAPAQKGCGGMGLSAVCVSLSVETQPRCGPTAALPRVPVFCLLLPPPPFPLPVPPFSYSLSVLPTLSPSLPHYFTQQTNPSAHFVPETLLRFRNELQHAFSTPEKSTVW